MNESVVNIYVFIIPMRLEIVSLSFPCLVVQGNVDLSALGFAFPAMIVISFFSARIKTPVIVAMNRYEKHIGVLIEDMVGTISSVDVII